MKMSLKRFSPLLIICLVLETQIYSGFGVEPKILHIGQFSVIDAYSRMLKKHEDLPIDIEQPPVYMATFSNNFLEEKFKPYNRLSSTRVAVAACLDGNPIPHYLHLLYIVEFCPETLPKEIHEALIRLYPDIDLSNGPFEGLKTKGFENFFITSCAFFGGADFNGPKFGDDFVIIPFGFIGPNIDQGTRDVYAGLFNSNGILLTSNLRLNTFYNLRGTPMTLGFTLCNTGDSFQSGYVAIIIPSERKILITHILITNQKAKIYNIADSFVQSVNFTGLLTELTSRAKSYSDPDRQILEQVASSLATLSGNLYEVHGPNIFYSKNFIPIEKSTASYLLAGEFQAIGVVIPPTLFFGIECCDENKHSIPSCRLTCIGETETHLIYPCTATEKVICVNDASKWELKSNRCVVFSTDNGFGKSRISPDSDIVYDIVNIEKCDQFWKIYLSKEIGRNYLKGTKVSEHVYAPRCLYLIKKSVIPNEWTKCIGPFDGNICPPKAKYMRFFVTCDAGIQFKNVELK